MSTRAVQSLAFCAGSAIASVVLQYQHVFIVGADIFVAAMAIIWALAPHREEE